MTLTKLISRKWRIAVAFAAALSVSACASTSTPEQVAMVQETNDPFEPANRYLFEINRFMDEIVFKPLAWWYRAALPDPIQNNVMNFMANLRTPWTMVNDLAQGSLDRFFNTVMRFLINTTFGIAGLFDPAADWGFAKHEEDFGQTLGVWGADEGPYLVLPIFGPSNVRDGVGTAVDSLLDPVNVIARGGLRGESNIPLARSVITGVDSRSRNLETIDQLYKSSVDFYATIRSVYRQRRTNEINNGESSSNFPALNVFPQ